MHYLFPLFFFLGALLFSLSTASMCFTGRPYSSAVRVYVDGRKGRGEWRQYITIPCGDCGCMCPVYNQVSTHALLQHGHLNPPLDYTQLKHYITSEKVYRE